jgi:hypothetical protein
MTSLSKGGHKITVEYEIAIHLTAVMERAEKSASHYLIMTQDGPSVMKLAFVLPVAIGASGTKLVTTFLIDGGEKKQVASTFLPAFSIGTRCRVSRNNLYLE